MNYQLKLKKKKHKAMKYKVFFIALFSLLSVNLLADAFEKERKITKIFPVKEDTEIQINNKYGNIEFINWEKDSVMFQVKISVKGNRFTKVEKTFGYINIEFTGNPYYVIAKTNFENEHDNLWSEVSDLTNSIFKGNNNTQINYTVFLPENLPLKITNKFGNIYLTNCNARTEIELSNGDLRANEINEFLQLNLSYGFANIKSINQAYIKLNYGDLRSINIEKIKLESRSSTIRCEAIDELQIESKRDKFYLGNINVFNGNFSFSELEIEELNELLKLDSNFGEITIEHVNNDFKNIYMNSNSTDISSTFSRTAIYNIDLLFNHRTEVSLPFNCEIISKEETGKNNDDTHLIAKSGQTTKASSKVKIEITSGSIRLSNK